MKKLLLLIGLLCSINAHAFEVEAIYTCPLAPGLTVFVYLIDQNTPEYKEKLKTIPNLAQSYIVFHGRDKQEFFGSTKKIANDVFYVAWGHDNVDYKLNIVFSSGMLEVNNKPVAEMKCKRQKIPEH